MEDIVEGVDLPYEDNNAPIGDVDGAAVPHEGERNVHFNALNGDADGAGEPHEDEREDVHMAEDGEGDHFPRFAEEFAAHAAADVLGQDVTPFERMRLFQDGSGGGTYAPFADLMSGSLHSGSSRMLTREPLKSF